MIGKLGFFMLFLTTIVMLQVFVEETEASSPTSLENACSDGGNSDCKETCQETKSKKTKKCYCSGTCSGSKCKCKRPKCKCQTEKNDQEDGPNDQ